MLSVTNPNKWSCLPAAFAAALEVDITTILGILGHDGSEITHPDFDDPLCRRGFHPQELIKMCLQDGMLVTRVELLPCAVPIVDSLPKYFDIGGWDWFKEQMFNTTGVLECRTATCTGHAMAYEGHGSFAMVCDPATTEVPFTFHEPKDAERRHRFITALWRIDNCD